MRAYVADPNADNSALSTVTFFATVPALGFQTYTIATTSGPMRAKLTQTNTITHYSISHICMHIHTSLLRSSFISDLFCLLISGAANGQHRTREVRVQLGAGAEDVVLDGGFVSATVSGATGRYAF